MCEVSSTYLKSFLESLHEHAMPTVDESPSLTEEWAIADMLSPQLPAHERPRVYRHMFDGHIDHVSEIGDIPGMGLFARPIQMPVVVPSLAIILMDHDRCGFEDDPVAYPSDSQTEIVLKPDGIAGKPLIESVQFDEEVLSARHVRARRCDKICFGLMVPRAVIPAPDRFP
jgi:hypothetical protein